jgi:hypothetical protein
MIDYGCSKLVLSELLFNDVGVGAKNIFDFNK